MSRASRVRRLRGPARHAGETLTRLWQSGGLFLLGGLAAGMTAFPAQTLTLLKPFSTAVVGVWRAGLGGVDAVGRVGSSGVSSLKGLTYTVHEADALKRQILELEQRAVLKEEEQRSLLRLRELLRLKRKLRKPAQGAAIIGGDPSTLFRTLVLDAGAGSRVREGAAVVAPAGAVGRILSVGPDHSVALWLTDPRSRIAAYVQRSRVFGVLEGQGTGCELKYLSVGDDVRVGDRVLTAGRGSAFPKGIVIGLVKEIHREGLLLSAVIAPAVDIRRLEEVLILDAGPAGP